MINCCAFPSVCLERSDGFSFSSGYDCENESDCLLDVLALTLLCYFYDVQGKHFSTLIN
jgi:hypothetical protein